MSSAEARNSFPPVLDVDDIAAGYGEEPVVKGVSLSVRAGEVLVIVGPNGAGKSTLLKALLGLVRVRSGEVRLHGKPVTNRKLEDLARRGVGYVPQSDDVFDTLRVSENLAMGGVSLTSRARAERMDVVLDVFPALKPRLKQHAGKLSGGQRKMVALARMLMPDPDALMLDEPTAGLSAELSRMVLEEQIALLAGLGKAIVMVEQKAQAALAVAHSGMVLVGGRVVLTGTGQELLNDPAVADTFLGGTRRERLTARSQYQGDGLV